MGGICGSNRSGRNGDSTFKFTQIRSEIHINKRITAIGIVVLMLAVSLVPLSLSNSEINGDTSSTFKVVYHSGNYSVNKDYNNQTIDKKETFTYHGVPTAEYNPQFWDFYTDCKNWNEIIKYGEIQTIDNWFDEDDKYLVASPENITVFTGWSTDPDNSSADPIDPGDDLTYLFSGDNSEIHLYATWDRAENIKGIGGVDNSYGQMNVSFDSGNKYTNLVLVFYHNISMSGGDHSIGSQSSKGFTVRSIADEDHWLDVSQGNGTSNIQVADGEGVIIDDIGLWTDILKEDSEDDPSLALYANGHQLILWGGSPYQFAN